MLTNKIAEAYFTNRSSWFYKPFISVYWKSQILCQIPIISKKTSVESHCILKELYGQPALSETTCRIWFRRFESGDFDLSNKYRVKPPKKFTFHWKDPERREMGGLRIERKRHQDNQKVKKNLWNFAWSVQKKVIFGSNCYWRWKVANS